MATYSSKPSLSGDYYLNSAGQGHKRSVLSSIQLAMEECFVEEPLGKGHVDWPNYIKALKDIGYNGYLTIEREVGADPAADIAMAVDFLKKNPGKIHLC